jgi:glucose-specific phosphotransferase system IIA component
MNWIGSLQQFGRSLMLPMIALPAVAVLLALSALPWTVWGLAEVSSYFELAANSILIYLPFIFAVGVALGLTDSAGMAGLAALLGYFIFQTLVGVQLELGVAGGVLFGLLAAYLFHQFKNLQFPESIQFFGGPRFTPFAMALASVVLSLLLLLIGPYLQAALHVVGEKLIALGGFGSFLYGTVHRLLIPVGLHHILNNFTWFQVGTYESAEGVMLYGDLPRFFAGDPEAGIYMAGMYPLMMFALPAAALAMILEARKEARGPISKIFITAALASFFTGVTEPIEFAFVFIAPWLYFIHALLAGSMMWVCVALDIHHGFAFSAGAIDYFLNLHLAKNGWLIIPVGLVYAVIYFALFRWAIRRFQLPTPGRQTHLQVGDTLDDPVERAPLILHALGGKENLVYLEACITRLRLTLKNERLIDVGTLAKLGSMGVIRLGGGNVQIVFGTYSELIREQMLQLMKSEADSIPFSAPADGRLLRLEEMDDAVFAAKMLGDGIALMPSKGELVAPLAGRITQIFPSKHAMVLTTEQGLHVLLHVGLDTVQMAGEGFTLFVEEHQQVLPGQLLLRFDLDLIREKARSEVIAMVITNANQVKSIRHSPFKQVVAGRDVVMSILLADGKGGTDDHV